MQINVDWFKNRKNGTKAQVNLMLTWKIELSEGNELLKKDFSSGISLAILQAISY